MAVYKAHILKVEKINSIESVLSRLKLLDKQLSKGGMEHFKLFNTAYYVVTNNIHQAIKDSYFENPEFINKSIVLFASYYFKAIKDSTSKHLNLSSPWSKLNEYELLKTPPKFVSLMLGANAHINYDLPQALNSLFKNKDAKELIGDLVKIDKLLMKSGKEIIGLFNEPNQTLNFLKRRLQFAYYRPAMYTILFWRIIAWKNYKLLKNDRDHIKKIQARSNRIAMRWLSLAKILS